MNQSAGHEDNKVEFIRRGPNPPTKFGYYDELQMVKLNIDLDFSVANAAK
jgi:hypothetical protein